VRSIGENAWVGVQIKEASQWLADERKLLDDELEKLSIGQKIEILSRL
jgi:hypothetical protein